jgi:diguanylate cyclase (GGDEF)-like protein
MIQSKHIKAPQLVLVVDDQEINRDVLGMILEDYYELIFACDGREAIQKIEENQDRLSLIMLDLIMPEMDGFAVLSYVHGSETLGRIPVIVLTAEKDAELRALQMGAADFIAKPFDMHEVIRARVGRIIELSEGRRLISAAEHDNLTMLYSRNFFYEYASRIHLYHPDWHMDAVVMDIDQFHIVNELNGREFGDNVLRIIGDEIRAFLAETEGIASRVEADRFDIFCRHQDDYQVLLDRLQCRMDGIPDSVSIRLRMGVMLWQPDAEPIVLFDRARAACSMVRGEYKTHLMIYSEALRVRELQNQRMLNDLRQAVQEKQLVVYYQPKYNIQHNPPYLSSAEALIRWNHPEMGMVRPDKFIKLFEENGLIQKLDRFVWEEAASQIAKWREKFGKTIPVSVNISRIDMYNPELVSNLLGLTQRYGVAPKDFLLEITESAYTKEAEQLISIVRSMRENGFSVEMDDFGSGYSSLNMLADMPLDVLKLDMRFVHSIGVSQKNLRMVELVMEIAKYLDVMVVAEGVENEEQLRELKRLGCGRVQGYYFSKPLTLEEFEKLIV